MGKTTDTFLWLKIRLPQTLSLLVKSYAAGRANNTKLLMLVSDFKVNSRLKILKGIFSGIHGMPLTSMRRKKDYTLPYNRVVMRFSLLAPNCLISSAEVYKPGGDLVETNN